MRYFRDQQSSLLQELRSLVQESRRIDYERNDQLQKLSSDLKEARDSISLAPSKKDLDKLTSKFATIAFESAVVANELKILRSLYFDSLKARHFRIPIAHTKTFDWIFRPEESQINFLQWLKTKSGIYWISGKAGSGKSTLMKYLYNHPRTEKELAKWAVGCKLVTASCFFWNAGSHMQKSQEGLLRSLLHEVLRKCPDLISIVCPSRWESAELYIDNQHEWQISELTEAVEELIRQNALPAKFCFFIDGLDEYDGDHREVIKVLKLLTSSPNIKICLSSRPWNTFEDAFGYDSEWKLRLQDLTREDIRIYVESELREHNSFALQLIDTSQCENLIRDIVERSQGVFLWVFLVLRSISNGLTNGDDIETLEKRVQALPLDLEQYFTDMLNQVEDIYLETMCQNFQVALHATEPLSLMTYSFINERAPDFAFQLETKPFDNHDIFVRHSVMRRRINALSKGLLEVYIDPSATDFWGYKVTWLHRTVRDFFFTKDVHSMLMDHQGTSFNANISLCGAYLALLKTMPRKDNHLQKDLQRLLDLIVYHAHQAELEKEILDIRLFYGLETIIQTVSQQIGKRFFPETSFLEYAIANGLETYVAHKLDEDDSLYSGEENGLLKLALKSSKTSVAIIKMMLDGGMDPNSGYRWPVWGEWFMKACRDRTIYREDFLAKLDLLLSYGANPNVLYEGSTVWITYLRWTSENVWNGVGTAKLTKHHFEILDKLLRFGADPHVCLKNLTRGSLGRKTALRNLFPPKLADRILQRLKQKTARKRDCSCNLLAWVWPTPSGEDVRQPLLRNG
jgi:hypothetical protein